MDMDISGAVMWADQLQILQRKSHSELVRWAAAGNSTPAVYRCVSTLFHLSQLSHPSHQTHFSCFFASSLIIETTGGDNEAISARHFSHLQSHSLVFSSSLCSSSTPIRPSVHPLEMRLFHPILSEHVFPINESAFASGVVFVSEELEKSTWICILDTLD